MMGRGSIFGSAQPLSFGKPMLPVGRLSIHPMRSSKSNKNNNQRTTPYLIVPGVPPTPTLSPTQTVGTQTPTPTQNQESETIWADRTSVRSPPSTIIHWSIANSTSAEINSFSERSAVQPQVVLQTTQALRTTRLTLIQTTTYTAADCPGPWRAPQSPATTSRSRLCSQRQHREQPYTASISADSTTIPYGTSTVIHWSIANSTSAVIDSSPTDPQFSHRSSTHPPAAQDNSRNLTQTTRYTLTALGPGGPAVATVTVSVNSGRSGHARCREHGH